MGTTNLTNRSTLVDLLNVIGPDGNLMTTAEVLQESNEIFQDMMWQEANATTYHQISRESVLPQGTFRRFNNGVPQEADKTINVLEALAMLESFSKPDKKLVDIAPNPSQYRSNKGMRFIRGLGQNWTSKLIYGNSATDPEEFTGLSPRLSSLSQRNVIGAGGSSNLTSIYIVKWSLDSAYMAFPRNHPNVGIVHEDMGTDLVQGANGGDYVAYVDHFEINGGLAVEDDLAIGRYANIETASGASNTFDEDHLIELINDLRIGPGTIYVNRKMKTQMQIKAKDKNNINYTFDQGEGLSGGPVVRFNGYEVKLVEKILNSETVIT